MCALSARLAGLLARHRARAELRGEEPYCGVGADAGCPSQAVTIAGRGTLPPGRFACLGRVATNGGLVPPSDSAHAKAFGGVNESDQNGPTEGHPRRPYNPCGSCALDDLMRAPDKGLET